MVYKLYKILFSKKYKFVLAIGTLHRFEIQLILCSIWNSIYVSCVQIHETIISKKYQEIEETKKKVERTKYNAKSSFGNET